MILPTPVFPLITNKSSCYHYMYVQRIYLNLFIWRGSWYKLSVRQANITANRNESKSNNKAAKRWQKAELNYWTAKLPQNPKKSETGVKDDGMTISCAKATKYYTRFFHRYNLLHKNFKIAHLTTSINFLLLVALVMKIYFICKHQSFQTKRLNDAQ